MRHPIFSNRALPIVMLTVFLDLVGFGILIPIQPYLALSFGASPWTVTLLSASYSLMQFLFVPLWGRISDRIGRRPVMLISVGITALGYLLFAMADSLVLLFVARMISGFGGANIGTAQAIIADSTSSKDRARGMGMIGIAFGLGFICGPAIGGVFGQFGLSAPAYAGACLSFINLMIAIAYLPETRWLKSKQGPKLAPSAKKTYLAINFSAALTTLRNAAPNVPRLLSLSFMITLAFSLFEQSLSLFVQATWVPEAEQFFGLGPAAAQPTMRHAVQLTTYFLVTVGLTSAVVQGGLIGRLATRFGERRLISMGTLTLAAGLFLLPLVGSLQQFWLLLIIAVMLAFGMGITLPSISSLLSKSASADEQGATLGLGQSLSALGRVIGPSFAGLFFELYRGAPFFIGSGLMLISVAISFFVRTAPNEESHQQNLDGSRASSAESVIP